MHEEYKTLHHVPFHLGSILFFGTSLVIHLLSAHIHFTQVEIKRLRFKRANSFQNAIHLMQEQKKYSIHPYIEFMFVVKNQRTWLLFLQILTNFLQFQFLN